MIKAIINGIMKLIISLVSLILVPIDALIDQFLPELGDLASLVGNYIGYCTQFIGWIIDAFFIHPVLVVGIIGYFTFKLTFWVTIHTVKLAIAWYNKLKI